MSEKKEQRQLAPGVVADALCSPPSHPTTLGNVWVGETQPSPTTLAAAFKLSIGLNEPRNR